MKSEKRNQGIPQGYIGTQELCQLFGRSRKTLHRMVELGSLPRPLTFGRQSIWERREIEIWLKHAKFAKGGKGQRPK